MKVLKYPVIFTLLLINVFSMDSQNPPVPMDSSVMRQQRAVSDPVNAMMIPNVILPSPESQKFMRYGNHTPSLATGTVNLSIPIYTIKAGNLSLPVALTYATNGIKVDDTPHPAGYGWIFQPATLRVTRVIMGRDDFKYHRDTRSPNDIEGEMNKFSYMKSCLAISPFESHITRDSRLDLFTVHLPDEKIDFVIEPDGSGWKALSDGSLCRISVSEKNIEVTDENGLVYIFGGDDNNFYEETLYMSSSGWENAINAWGLRQILLPGGMSVSFEWESVGGIDSRPEVNDKRYKNVQDFTASDYYSRPREYAPVEKKFGDPLRFTNGVNTILLKKINFPLGSVSFSYNNDLYQCLESIEVKNLSQASIKSANFEYNSDGNLLEELTFSGEKPYLFKYNPNRITNYRGFDYWGFYNGEHNLANLISSDITIESQTLPIYTGSANRKVNDTYIQANLLEKITYPTGGFTTFEYETHRFQGNTASFLKLRCPGIIRYQELSAGGGVRLKKMISKASDTSPALEKIYKYGKANISDEREVNINADYSGLGIVPDEPTADTFVEEYAAVTLEIFSEYQLHTPWYITNRTLIAKSQSNIFEYMFLEPLVWYDQVTEYVNDLKTVYNFEYENTIKNNPEWSFSGARLLPLIEPMPYSYYSWNYDGTPPFSKRFPKELNTIREPVLKEKKTYIKTNDRYIEVEKKEYEFGYRLYEDLRNQYVFVAFLNNLISVPNLLIECYAGQSPHFGVVRGDRPCFKVEAPSFRGAFVNFTYDMAYDYGEYSLKLARQYPLSETTTTYNENGTVILKTIYNYQDRDNKQFLKNKLTSTSISGNDESKMFKVEYLYPWENLSDLTAGQKINVQQMIDNNRIATPVRLTQSVNNKLKDKKIITYLDYGNGLILPQRENYTTMADTGQVRIIYHNYDSYGNPVYITQDGINKTAYIWSYNGQYPIAEIKNATYSEINQALGALSTNIEALSANVSPDVSRIDQGLRSYFSNKQVMITTYTYTPLIGIVSVIDPQGIKTTYEYDSFNRLKSLKNHTGKIIEAYDYHYQNY